MVTLRRMNLCVRRLWKMRDDITSGKEQYLPGALLRKFAEIGVKLNELEPMVLEAYKLLEDSTKRGKVIKALSVKAVDADNTKAIQAVGFRQAKVKDNENE